MKTERWTADRIREEFKARKGCLVTVQDGKYKDLSMTAAAKLDGTYLISKGGFETLILLDSRRPLQTLD